MSIHTKEYIDSDATDSGEIKFLTFLQYKDFAENLWEYTLPFRFRYRGKTYCIPDHFVTDFYSIPRWLRWIFPNNQGVYNESAGIHDWAVRNRKLLGFSLTDCHYVFNAAMRYQHMSTARRKVKFSAVYLFNWLVAEPGDGSIPEYMREAVNKKHQETQIKYYEASIS